MLQNTATATASQYTGSPAAANLAASEPAIHTLVREVASALERLEEKVDKVNVQFADLLAPAPTTAEAKSPTPPIGHSKMAHFLEDVVARINRQASKLSDLTYTSEI